MGCQQSDQFDIEQYKQMQFSGLDSLGHNEKTIMNKRRIIEEIHNQQNRFSNDNMLIKRNKLIFANDNCHAKDAGHIHQITTDVGNEASRRISGMARYQ